jgi:magnesium transporter
MYHIAQVGEEKVIVEKASSLDKVRLGDGLVWVHLVAKTENELAEIKKFFGFHKLAVEDCIDRQQRPKLEIYDNCVLVIVKELELKGNVVVNQLGLFVGSNYLVTVSSNELAEIEYVMGGLTKGDGIKPDFLAHRILDRIVDSYFPVLDGVEDEIEAVESGIIKKPNDKNIAEKIFRIRRELLSLRKAIWPAREVFSSLSKGGLPFVSKKSLVYYRDVYDHVILVIDLVETYRDLVSGVLETHLSSISNSLNEVMKVLTVIATIFIPLTFITGLYGMNFLNMPEIRWEYGYGFALVLMLVVGLGLVAYFKRKGWM